jgi:hypothetical protein
VYVRNADGSLSVTYKLTSRVIAQAARRWVLTAETRFQSRMTSSEIRDGRSGSEAGSSPSSLVFPANYHSSIAPYSSIAARRGVR